MRDHLVDHFFKVITYLKTTLDLKVFLRVNSWFSPFFFLAKICRLKHSTKRRNMPQSRLRRRLRVACLQVRIEIIKPGPSWILCFCILYSPSLIPGCQVLHYFLKLCSLMEMLPLIGAFAFQTRLGLEITSPRWTTNPQPKMWKALSSVPCLNPSSHAALQPHMNCTAPRIWWEAHLFLPQEFSVSARKPVPMSWSWERQVEV